MKQKKYQIILEYIENKIKDGSYQPTNKIESENILSKKFNVSRETVRKALSDLESKAIIFKVQGKGNFISEIQPFTMSSGIGFTTELARQGKKAKTIEVKLKKIIAKKEIANDLSIKIGDPVWQLERIRCADDRVITYEKEFFPYYLMPEFTEKIAKQSVYNWLEKEKKVKLSYANEEISAILADEFLAKKLNVEMGTPILHVRLIAYSTNNIPFNMGDSYYISEKFHLSMKVFAN